MGTVYRAGIPAAYRLYGGTYREFLGDTTAPATGTWLVGDRVMRFNPTVGQPLGWVCTVAGTPGTWVALANL